MDTSMRDTVRSWFERHINFGVPANLDEITDAVQAAIDERRRLHPEDFVLLSGTTVADVIEQYTECKVPGPRPVFETAASLFPNQANERPYNLPAGSVIAGEEADDFADALHEVGWMREYLKASAEESLARGYTGPMPRLSCWRVVAVGDMGDYGALQMIKMEDQDL